MLSRRQFLITLPLVALALQGCPSPVGQSSALKDFQLARCQSSDGTLKSSLPLQCPEKLLRCLERSPHGLLFAGANLLVAVSNEGKVITLKGPEEGLYTSASGLLSGEKVSGEEYRLRAHDLASGKVRWEQTLGYSQLLGFSGSVLCLATPTDLRALDLETGQELWKRPDLVAADGSYFEGDVGLVSSGNTGMVHRLDLKSGKSLQELRTNKDGMRVTVLAAHADRLLALVRRQAILGFRTDDPNPLWKVPISSEEHQNARLLVSGDVILLSLDNSAQAFQISTGKRLWSSAPVLQPPVETQGVVLLPFARLVPGEEPRTVFEARTLLEGKKLWELEVEGSLVAASPCGNEFLIFGEKVLERKPQGS